MKKNVSKIPYISFIKGNSIAEQIFHTGILIGGLAGFSITGLIGIIIGVSLK